VSSIFISYRRVGALVHARALFERLRHEFGPNEVFIDLEGVDYGLDFVVILNEQLNGCQVMLALIDPQWATATDRQGRRRIDRENDYVRTEIETALSRGIRTVPVLIDGAEMPDASDLPESLRPLTRRNALILDFNRFDAEISRLIGVIRKLLCAPYQDRESEPELQRKQEPELRETTADASLRDKKVKKQAQQAKATYPGQKHEGRLSTKKQKAAIIGFIIFIIAIGVFSLLIAHNRAPAPAAGSRLTSGDAAPKNPAATEANAATILQSPGDSVRFKGPSDVHLDKLGNLYVADAENNTIVKIATSGAVVTLAGSPGESGSEDGYGNSARFNNPTGLAVDSSGNIYVADSDNQTVRKIMPDGSVVTLAGSPGHKGSAVRDDNGKHARFAGPEAVAVDVSGNIYVADTDAHTIRKISSTGDVTTLAGSSGKKGSRDELGDAARFNSPSGLAVDRIGNVYVSDCDNRNIRKISPEGAVTTLAGSADKKGFKDGTGRAAIFTCPTGITIDSNNNLYVLDDLTVRRITPAGVVATIAGSPGKTGVKNGSSEEARFNRPTGLDIDLTGNIYIAELFNAVIRKVTPTGVVSTFAGRPYAVKDTKPRQFDEDLNGKCFTYSASSSGPTNSPNNANFDATLVNKCNNAALQVTLFNIANSGDTGQQFFLNPGQTVPIHLTGIAADNALFVACRANDDLVATDGMSSVNAASLNRERHFNCRLPLR
jgi:sugar lactone lactonase YvrE